MTERTRPNITAPGVLAVLWGVVPAVMGFVLLSQIGPVSAWLLDDPQRGFAVYVAVFAVTSGCGLLPTYAQAVLGGWVFGIAAGLPGALLGFAGGALLGFLITRLVASDRVERWIASNEKANAVRDALLGHGFWRTLGIVTLVRVPPNSPFSITNFALSSTGVRLPVYLFGTIVGMAPRTAVAVALAAAGAATGAADIQTFVKEKGLWPFLIGLGVMIVVIAIIGSIARRALDRVTAAVADGQPGEADSE